MSNTRYYPIREQQYQCDTCPDYRNEHWLFYGNQVDPANTKILKEILVSCRK